MSGVSDTALLNEQASVKTSRSRASVVASIRHKTSSFFGRNVTNMADKDSQPIQVQPPPAKRHWFTSVGLRFSKGNHQALNSHESSSSDEARAEYWEQAGTGTIAPPSSPELSAAQPSTRSRRFNSSRLKLNTLPAKFRRGGAGLPHPPSSTSLSDMGDIPAITFPKPRSTPTGSWSSFRMGIQKAVREAVNGNFRFSDDRGERSHPIKPAARPPVRTLWTIMSADSSEGHASPNKSTQGIPPTSLKSTRSMSTPPSPSASSHNITVSSAPTTPNDDPTPSVSKTVSRACSVASSSNSTTVLKPGGGGGGNEGDQASCCSRKASESTVAQDIQVLAKAAAVAQENQILAEVVAVAQEIQMVVPPPPKSPAREKAPELPVVVGLGVLRDVGNKGKGEDEVKGGEVEVKGAGEEEDDDMEMREYARLCVVGEGKEVVKKEDVKVVVVGEENVV